MESNLYARFCKRRKEGRAVRRIWFQLASKLAFKEAYPDRNSVLEEFKFSTGWFNGFLSRWNLSLRATTNKAQYIPTHYQQLIVNWLQFNRRNSQLRTAYEDYKYEVGRFDLAHIANMDQTPLPFEYLTGKTYSHRGDKTIWTKSERSGWDKRQATLALTVFADGVDRVKPLIIFRGTEDPLKQQRYYGSEIQQYDSRVTVWFNSKGYSNTKTTLKWINELLIPAFHTRGPSMWNGGPSLLQTLPSGKPQPAILSLDAAHFHHSPEVLAALRDHDIIPSLIPAGCTGLIQVLDVSVNKPLKELIRNELDIMLESMGQQALDALDDSSHSAIGRRRILMTHVVGAAWEKVLVNTTPLYIYICIFYRKR